jgi:hypothetical protein
MSETRTPEWRELCLEAASESNPERRKAIVVKLGRILQKDVLKFGPLRVDVGRRQVTRNGKPVCLTELEFQLLRHFIERAGRPLSRNELLRSVWGYDRGAFTRTVSRLAEVDSFRRDNTSFSTSSVMLRHRVQEHFNSWLPRTAT